MRSGIRSVDALAVVLVLIASPSVAAGMDGSWRYSLAAATASFPRVNLDGGGETGLTSYHLRGGVNRRVDSNLTLGISATYDIYDRSFSSSEGFAGLSPWSQTTRVGITGSLTKRTRYGWSYGVRPFVSWFSESGEIDSDALSYGTALAVVGGLSPDQRAGLGFRLSREIDDSLSISPVFIVDWKLNEKWSLGNPYETDFTAPAGLEIRYRHDEHWRFALAGVFQSYEFRLDESGFAPEGIGETSGFLSFFRVTRQWNPYLTINGYLGVMLNGELQVENAGGTKVASSKFDSAPLAAFSLQGSF